MGGDPKSSGDSGTSPNGRGQAIGVTPLNRLPFLNPPDGQGSDEEKVENVRSRPQINNAIPQRT